MYGFIYLLRMIITAIGVLILMFLYMITLVVDSLWTIFVNIRTRRRTRHGRRQEGPQGARGGRGP